MFKKQQHKTLGIQQRIPLDILFTALQDELKEGLDEMGKTLLTNLIGVKYGFNRSCENSTYCAIPQFIEAELISRSKTATYILLEPQAIQHPITWEIWKECFFINEPLYNREETENLSFEPFFRFVVR